MFSQGLRWSRLAGKNRDQVISASPASRFRNDYGLKAPVPAPGSSKYLRVRRLDNEQGIMDYQPAGSAYTLKRVASLHKPVWPLNRTSLFSCNGDSNDSATSGTNKRITKLNWKQSRSIRPPLNRPTVTAGLSYTLPGVLMNRKSGLADSAVVTGRLLERRKAAVAGVVAQADLTSALASTSAILLEDGHEFAVQSIALHPLSAKIDMKVVPYRNDSRAVVGRLNRPIGDQRTSELYMLIRKNLFD